MRRPPGFLNIRLDSSINVLDDVQLVNHAGHQSMIIELMLNYAGEQVIRVRFSGRYLSSSEPAIPAPCHMNEPHMFPIILPECFMYPSVHLHNPLN
jgi:hypothetical protein